MPVKRAPGDDDKECMSRALPLLATLLLAGCPDLPEEVPVEDGSSDDVPDLAEEVVLELPVCDGGVLNAFAADAVQPPSDASSGWMPPEADTRAAIASSWAALTTSDPMLAVGTVAVVGYQLCRGEEAESDLVLWRPAVPGTGRALFAWRYRDARAVVIEAPHAFVDPEGPLGALLAFERTGGRGLIAAGTHPCANEEAPACGAGSGLCGGIPSESDASMNDTSIFQLAHELFSGSWSDDWIVSLQAMDEEGVALSDGTLATSMGGAAVAIGAEVLAESLTMLVTTCNGLQGAEPGRRYCGTEAVQARHSNDMIDICSDDAPKASGRYVQITQSPAARAQAEPLARAIDAGLATAAR